VEGAGRGAEGLHSYVLCAGPGARWQVNSPGRTPPAAHTRHTGPYSAGSRRANRSGHWPCGQLAAPSRSMLLSGSGGGGAPGRATLRASPSPAATNGVAVAVPAARLASVSHRLRTLLAASGLKPDSHRRAAALRAAAVDEAPLSPGAAEPSTSGASLRVAGVGLQLQRAAEALEGAADDEPSPQGQDVTAWKVSPGRQLSSRAVGRPSRCRTGRYLSRWAQ
jgi:hypothetical protein